MLRLDGKVAAVTGGGSGIGRAVADLFARQGATVHIIDVNPSVDLTSIEAEGGRMHIHTCDITNQQQVQEIFQKIQGLNILVNNAGIAHIGTAESTTAADFDKVFNVNVKGVYNCLNAAIPVMKQSGGGAIVNMCSVAALVGLSDRFAYSMSKGAVYSMTMSVAKDYLPYHIRCNSVSPARVHTPFVDGFISKNYAGKEEEMFEKLSKSQPIGRMGTVHEIANMVLFLASDEAQFITGNDYPIDGGFLHLNT
jgi:2-keto-3-deoxy-L-fuconate dehydrogenase